ncbi:FAD/NAD(P)-binding protein [Frateuria defendens]|uniref:FAD/NAD(P)-binding protein n=1 Tax=Frateuria defendens TaxID=2219559 RepID=UPI00066FCAC9|nr:FAD/NAD(P)-binding protein [Frateuria defendens]
MFRRVAIIGGGAAAAALLSELIDRAPATTPLHVDWYTGGGRPGRGVAYGTDSPRHLLNVRAASMGMFTGKPLGFLDYAQRQNPDVAGTDFLPRRLYGDYLESEVRRALAQAQARDHDVRVLPFAADALVPEPGGVTVLQGEESRRADAAVLALGTLPNQPLAGVEPALLEDRYVIDPWALLARGDDATPPRQVALIGLGLTAVDVLLELAARWPQTRFVALSRHGRLPEPHLPAASAPADDGGALVEAMRDKAEVRHWTHLLRDACAASRDWRTVIDSLRPHTPGLWAGLVPEERARFLRHARWAWERVRHRLPPAVAEAMAELEHSGRLQRLRGRMRAVRRAGDGVQLDLELPHGSSARALEADLAIQAIGLDTDARRTHHPLVRQLVTNGHVLPEPLGQGLAAEDDGRLHHGGGVWPHVYAIGSLLRGALWESTAMPEIRQQARGVAERLLAG